MGGEAMKISFQENGLFLQLSTTEKGRVILEHLGAEPMTRQISDEIKEWFHLVEIKLTNCNQINHRGSRHMGSSPGDLLTYVSHKDYSNEWGRKLEIVQEYQKLFVESHLQFYDGMNVISSYTVVRNESEQVLPMEYVSSFALTGIKGGKHPGRDKNSRVYLPHNTWYGEAQWKSYSLNEAGYDEVGLFSMKKVEASSTGTWPSHEFLPMGAFTDEDRNLTYTWQIETSCSWNYEISDCMDELYLQLYGPVYDKNHFLKMLGPGERFQTVPAAIAVVKGDFEDSIRELTKYRRRIRRINTDNEKLPVIFNDYMNCLFGDPTTEKLYPLIEKAAQSGCDYFCIDAGWYDKGPWWDGIGEWKPSVERFPGGIEEPLNYIRRKGMIPGLWLEIEGMGIHCAMADQVPKDWFFQRNGEPVVERSRYQLDFRNAQVREYASSIIHRLVNEYGIGYIKMDYNVNFGTGTSLHADSPGDGLLQHTRAYLGWLREIFDTYPELIIENCGSGGMRLSYSFLKEHSIQSVTDQTDYIRMAAIAANAMTALTPEQAGIWSYPLGDGDEEETVFNMVNAMLMRIHQSGHIAQMSPQRLALIQEGIACYKTMTEDIKRGYPVFPLGLGDMSSEFLCAGVETEEVLYLAVWRTSGSQETVDIDLKQKGRSVSRVTVLYPKDMPTCYSWEEDRGRLKLKLGEKTARLFKIIK